ncbi:MAG: hypothetical protein AAB516_01105 [Patescibacteria group bacterium]
MRIELIIFFLALATFLFFRITRARDKTGVPGVPGVQSQPQEVKEVKKERKKISFGWVISILILAIAGYGGYKYFSSISPSQPSLAAEIRWQEIIVQPNQWSENFSIPPYHWFRIRPEGKVRYKFWDGQEIEDEPGKPNWLGDEITLSNFRIKSMEDKEVKVIIFLRPKIKA